MARYYRLVASVKSGYGFSNEEVIQTEEPFTSLEEIDIITCSYLNQEEFIKSLEYEGWISGKNWISIQYTKQKENRYLHPLFGYPNMKEIIKNLKQVTDTKDGHPITYKIIPHDHPFFQEKLKELYYYLGNEPGEFFSEVFDKNPPKYLEKLVYNYYDMKKKEFDTLEDEYEFKDLSSKIELEFSRYKIFRGYLIYMDRYFKKHPEAVRVNFHEKIEDIPIKKEEETTYDYEEFLTDEELETVVPQGDEWLYGPKK